MEEFLLPGRNYKIKKTERIAVFKNIYNKRSES